MKCIRMSVDPWELYSVCDIKFINQTLMFEMVKALQAEDCNSFRAYLRPGLYGRTEATVEGV